MHVCLRGDLQRRPDSFFEFWKCSFHPCDAWKPIINGRNYLDDAGKFNQLHEYSIATCSLMYIRVVIRT